MDAGGLRSYLRRVGADGPVGPALATLRALHRAHVATIPFENLDVRLGRRVGLDLDSLVEKLVHRGRGGYCFEHNTLFAAVLRAIGFEVETLEARVRPPGAGVVLPRTHMLLSVSTGDRRWLADVGFGGTGPVEPVAMDGEIAKQGEDELRVVAEGTELRVLQLRDEQGWRDLYAFGSMPAMPVDFAVAHHFTSTHPSSPFVTGFTVQRSTLEVRFVLRGLSYSERRGFVATAREVDASEVPRLAREVFLLDVADDEVLAALNG